MTVLSSWPRGRLLSPNALLAVALVVAGGLPVGLATAQEVDTGLDRAVTKSLHGADDIGKDGPMAKLGTNLLRLYHDYERHRARKTAARFAPEHSYLPVHDDEWVVIDAVARHDPQALRAELEALGLRRAAVSGHLVSGLVRIEELDAVAGLRSLHQVRASMAMRHSGAATSQGDVAVYADSLRQASVLDGQGTLVGALSDSYDNPEDRFVTHASDDIEAGDLPGPSNPNNHTTPVSILDDGITGFDEGRAMLQIIHDLAPGANLAFHTAFGGLARFVEGIQRLAAIGCDVIVDDIFYLAEPMFQDGPIGLAIQDAVTQNDVIYVTASGNAGDTGYASAFRDSGVDVSSTLDVGVGDFHDFDPGMGTAYRQQVTLAPSQSIVVSLQWDDPYRSVSGAPGADTDLDLYIMKGSEVVARSVDANVGGDPVEVLVFQNNTLGTTHADLAIARVQGPAPERLKYVAFQGLGIDEYDTNSPTISGHSDADGALSVAAAAWYNTPRVPTGTGISPPLLNSYSSKGGTQLLFSEEGRRLEPPVVRQKPDLTAPDGVNTTFFGFDIVQDLDGHPNFFGTSAAAPHVAAVAALMRQARPTISPEAVRDQLQNTAVDLVDRLYGGEPQPTAVGHDHFSGAGLIQANDAVHSLLPVHVTEMKSDVDEGSGGVRLDWVTVREEQSRQFILEYHPGRLQDDPRRIMWNRVGTVSSKAMGGASTDTLRYDLATTVPSPGRYVFRVRHEQEDGTTQPVGPRMEINVPFEGSFAVGGPRPNPVRGDAKVQLVVEQAQRVQMHVYDAIGRRVREVHDGYLVGERPLLLQIDASDLASGVYFLRVVGENFETTRRMVRIR